VGRKGRGKDARAPGQGDGKNGYRKGRSGKCSDVTTNVTEVYTEKTKCMLLYHHRNAGQNLDLKIGNRSFENVAQFMYLRTTITNENLI
jgi:hypothetical protein